MPPLEPETIYLPTAWSITSNLLTNWSLGPAPTIAGRTMDDVLSMDNVISMDTLEEAGGVFTSMDAVSNIDHVVNMNTLEETE